MFESRFCFRISKEAGMAEDSITKEPAECYVEVKMEFDKPIDEEQYKSFQEKLSINIAAETDLPVHYFEPITPEEYDKEMEEDENEE